jgi:hypothetical protein
MKYSSLKRSVRRSAAATIVAAAVTLPLVADAAGFTLSAPTPASVTVGAKGMMTFHMKMTPPPNAAGTNVPTGFMTVIRQGDTAPIWCFPNAGTLCYTGSIANGAIDVHVYMPKLAASAGTLLFQLRDPNSSALYSNALAVPVHGNILTSGGHVITPANVGPITKPIVPLKVNPATAVPAASPKP